MPSALQSWRYAAAAISVLGFAAPARAQTAPAISPGAPNVLSQYVVTATRAPVPPNEAAATTAILTSSDLQSAPTVTLDDALRALPSFTLFRRNDSLTANPTTQGVSLRGLGPNGASRSLVLLDGVPLNDPFGGWVSWAQLPRDSIIRVELAPGGGASAWGNATLSGVIQLFTTTPIQLGAPSVTAANSGQFTLLGGDFGTRSASARVAQPVGSGMLELSGEDFTTDGVVLIAPERRGPIDIAAWSRHRSAMARWSEPLGSSARIAATFRSFEEFRGNGTPYQRNGSREKFASVAAESRPTDAIALSFSAYAQDESYASTFSSVNATRTAETPASDQFAVPATAYGASLTGTWQGAKGASTTAGLDWRSVEGETRENYSYSNGSYTRQRIAGGAQDFGGAFVTAELPITPSLHAVGGLRVDDWSNANGHRRETDRATGTLLRDDHDRNRNGTEFSPSAGLAWTPAPEIRVHANAQHAFRDPTLNELYRPFRQGANVTEANPDLRAEHVTSAELGSEWTPFPRIPKSAAAGAAREPLVLGATLFWDDLRDAVSNVTIARGPGNFPLFGVLPAGGIGRQRLNLNQVRVQGAELSATWNATTALSLTGRLLDNDTRVQRADVAPALVGHRLAEIPRQSAVVEARWRAGTKLSFTSRLRWIGRQWDDDENTLRLGEAIVADLGVSCPVSSHFELYFNVENIGNARVETARSADGIFNVGTPRFAFGGIRGRW